MNPDAAQWIIALSWAEVQIPPTIIFRVVPDSLCKHLE